MATKIAFHGAARTVTGSKHLLTIGNKQILVDCGMFQGPRELRDRNYEPFPFDPADLDAVILTHAHMDHVGMIPKLIRDGYRGPVYCTRATKGISAISLPDSGRLQEEDAYQDRKRGRDVEPLYDEKDAYAALKSFEAVPYHQFHALPGGAQFQFRSSGHILGSAYAEIFLPNGERVLMTGDLGRYDAPIIKDPETVDWSEYLVIESTYGDRLHPQEDPLEFLHGVLSEVVADGSVLLVPSFAIGRTQELLYFIRMLQIQGRLPRIPIFVDSPMATSTTALYGGAKEEWDEEMTELMQEQYDPIEPEGLQFTRDRNSSKALNSMSGPMVIIAGSGMANGGRIQHHLLHRLGQERTHVLFTGYQAAETLGRRLLEGAPTVQIMGREVEVRAKVDKISSLSAHADQNEIFRFLGGFRQAPKTTFLVHGEPEAQDALAERIRTELGWNVEIPEHGQEFDLG